MTTTSTVGSTPRERRPAPERLPAAVAAGMQSLVKAVRSVDAIQPLMLGGLAWSSDETGTNYNGTPAASGVGLKDHLAALAAARTSS